MRRLSEPKQHHNVVVSMLITLATAVENTVSTGALVLTFLLVKQKVVVRARTFHSRLTTLNQM